MTKPIYVDGGGIVGKLSDDLEVEIYKGIPYAAPPINELRWKAPHPVVPWEGIKECMEFGPSAIQPLQGPFLMWSTEFIIDTSRGYSEDCLTLNIWTKRELSEEKRPVIVYIHGGGFTSGGASCEVYDGEAIAKKDIVYVNINYRVGILGYLAHPELSGESEDGVSGNYGVLDQVEALKWVKKNISKFGGDPDNVTIVGQSAGSDSVNALIMTPKAKGLFKNAVAMSFNYINFKIDTIEEKEAESSKLFKGKTLKDMRNMTTEELLALNYKSSPCIDGNVIPSKLLDMLKNGTQNDVKLMNGMVQGDVGLFPSFPIPPFAYPTTMKKEEFEIYIRNTFRINADQCLVAYPIDSDEAIGKFNEINEDGMMMAQIYLAKARALKSKSTTYIYYFNYVMPGENEEKYGAFHTADVPYFLNYFSPLRKDYWTELDYDLGDKMSSYLVNFAKSGNPNGQDLEKWDSYSNRIEFINFGDVISIKSLTEEKVKFWEDYYSSIFGI